MQNLNRESSLLNMHTATVIIPVAEWRWFVKRAVFSALDQGETVSEVLLVDNADDHLDKSFREELLADNRVRIVVSDIKNNAARARNLGIRETKSEFIKHFLTAMMNT